MGGVGVPSYMFEHGRSMLHGRSIATWEEWEKHFYKRTWEEHCYKKHGRSIAIREHGRSTPPQVEHGRSIAPMGGVGGTFLQANMGGALLHGRSGRNMLLQANMGGALLHGRSGRNIPTSEHGRSMLLPWEECEKHLYKRTWEEHCYMGGVEETFLPCSNIVGALLQANMGGAFLPCSKSIAPMFEEL